MIEKYCLALEEKSFAAERDAAFAQLREAIAPWRELDSNCYVALGSESDSGEWSVIFEDGFWLVYIGERGERSQISIFPSVWDAVSYAGFRATSGRGLNSSFPVLAPTPKF